MAIEEGSYHLFEDPVELGPIGPIDLRIADGQIGPGAQVGSDGPAGDPLDVALDPPAVEDAEAGYAVEGGFHPARPRGLVGGDRVVQPDVDPGHEEGGQVHPVVLEVDDGHGAGQGPGGGVDPFDEGLAGLVEGVSLAAVDDLEGPDPIHQRPKPVGPGQEEVIALVGGGTGGNPVGEG